MHIILLYMYLLTYLEVYLFEICTRACMKLSFPIAFSWVIIIIDVTVVTTWEL